MPAVGRLRLAALRDRVRRAEAGEQIQLGIGLTAAGTLWLDQVELREVSRAVPVTGEVAPVTGPVNFDFEAAHTAD